MIFTHTSRLLLACGLPTCRIFVATAADVPICSYTSGEGRYEGSHAKGVWSGKGIFVWCVVACKCVPSSASSG